MTTEHKPQREPDLHALLSERTASFNAAEHRIRELEERIKLLENLLPTALERETMRKVVKYAEMVEKHLAKDGL